MALACLALAGCPMDHGRQFDQRFPATLILTNDSASTLTVNSVYSSVEASGAFILDQQELAANEATSVPITQSTYDALRGGHFAVQGQCDEGDTWTRPGPTVSQHSVTEGTVTLTLDQCRP